MPATPMRNININMRATAQEKLFLQKAAELAGFTNLTNFILTIARKEATKILSDTSSTYLTAKDWELVNALIAHPEKPNKKLKALLTKKIKD